MKEVAAGNELWQIDHLKLRLLSASQSFNSVGQLVVYLSDCSFTVLVNSHRSLSVVHYLLSTKQTTNTEGSWLKVKHLGAKEANISHNSWWNLKKKS